MLSYTISLYSERILKIKTWLWLGLQVGWDVSTTGDRQPRVSLWEIEPLTTFPMYPSRFPLRLQWPWPLGLPSFHGERLVTYRGNFYYLET